MEKLTGFPQVQENLHTQRRGRQASNQSCPTDSSPDLPGILAAYGPSLLQAFRRHPLLSVRYLSHFFLSRSVTDAEFLGQTTRLTTMKTLVAWN